MDKTRIDKWLWMVRVFKTRTIASDACNAGKVKINDNNAKPSKEIQIGQHIQVRLGQLQKQIVVVDIPKNRIPAKLVPDFYQDITPIEEYERIKMLHSRFEFRENGLGRPTKRDRRQLDYLKDFLAVEEDWDDEEID